ncbi:MAG: hypothetical protein M1503_12795 [Thaumarchaeota archaeon]|nr:hypothetical protein [Nitrososphaerota archaeon]MCL5319117.1 hypothetical protein [Nitrososphaerota archaeon]
MGETAREKNPVKCVECGSVIPLGEKAWRKCFMCGDPICIEHTYFIRTRRQGLYDYYDDAVRVCRRCRI